MVNLSPVGYSEAIPIPERLKDNVQSTDSQVVKRFLYLRRCPNPEYLNGLKPVPLRTCLLHHKSDKNPLWIAKTQPKWFTNLLEYQLDLNTGEMNEVGVYQTDCLTSANNRKIKAVNRFVQRFSDLYWSKKVTMWFYTLTTANQSKLTISQCMNTLKKRLTRNGVEMLGYLWVLEVSDDLHVHYHALVVTNRMNFRGKQLPDFLKVDDVWGCICQVEAVKISVKYYLSKYFIKNKVRIQSDSDGKRKRQYGCRLPKD
jgi:hypothetical protein